MVTSNYIYTKRISLIVSLILILVIVTSNSLIAAPWWWVHFTKGDDVSDALSNYEKWMAFAINDASTSETVYVASYTWGTGNLDPISGLDGGNDVGVNAVAAAKNDVFDPNNYIIDDGGGEPDLAQLSADANNVQVTEAGANIHHNKLVVIPGRRVITGSANFTAGAYSSQPNNMLVIKSSMSDVINRYVSQCEELRDSTFHDNTQTGPPYYFNSPNGDTIEVYFSPDDHGWIPKGNGPGYSDPDVNADSDVEAVVMRVIKEARESIFYIINFSNMQYGSFSPNVIEKLVDSTRFVEGVFHSGTGFGSLQNDHTCRDSDAWFNDGLNSDDEIHHKVYIIDQEVIITGSANTTSTSLSNPSGNDENIVVVHDFRLGRRFTQEYRRLMALLSPENIGQADSFETSPPQPVSGLTVTPGSTNFTLRWNKSNATDFSRYYIFISTYPIYTNAQLGDSVDQDNDGYYNEDPRGDADGFASGQTLASAQSANDDADALIDEDTWLWPEAQIKDVNDTDIVLTTYNVGDALVSGIDYWFAVVGVDTHGNESIADTEGPYQLSSSVTYYLNVTKIADVTDTPVMQGDTPVTVFFLNIDSDTDNDTLKTFKIKNLGSADTNDIREVALYHDVNRDSHLTSGDTLVAILSYSSGYFQNTSFADSIPDAGDSYIVVIWLYDTAGIGDTLQFQIPAYGVESIKADSGPSSALTNNTILVIQSVNQIDVDTRGDYASNSSVTKGDTILVMALRISVTQSNDTLTAFAITNLGTMTTSDIDYISVYHDAFSDSQLTSADTFIKTLTFTGSSTWKDTQISYIFYGTTLDVIVAVKTLTSATGGNTFQGRIPSRTVDSQKGDSGPLSNLQTTALFTIASDTSPDTAIVLNEYIPDPSGQDHDYDGTQLDADEEFIELYNNSDGSVDIGNWKLDDDFSPGDITIPAGVILGPRQFFIAYAATDSAGRSFYIYDTTGRIILDSGAWSGTWNGLNNSQDSVAVSNASNTLIDTVYYTAYTAGKSNCRLIDAWSTWNTDMNVTPGKNSDPTATQNRPSPNGYISVLAAPDSITSGDTTLLTMIVKDSNDDTVTAFTYQCNISISTGNISPSQTSNFVNGSGTQTVTVSNINEGGTTIITISYNTTTYGTKAIWLSPPAPADYDGSGTMSIFQYGVVVTSDTEGDTAQYDIIFYATENLASGTVTFIIPQSWSDLNNTYYLPGYFTVSSSQAIADSYLISETMVKIRLGAIFNTGDTVAIKYGAGVGTGAIIGSGNPAVFYVYSADSNTTQGGEEFADSVPITIYSPINVSGTVTFEGRTTHYGAIIEIYNGTDTYQATSDTSGTFVVQVWTSGLYNIEVKEFRSLAKRLYNYNITTDTNIGTIGPLLIGDSREDNMINLLDASFVKIYTGTTSDTRADVNNSGGPVDSTDMSYIRKNFGRIGE
ncbi:MAG: phospholipase D-like domain-containing protein [Candidatus Hydrogenedentota bacterium]